MSDSRAEFEAWYRNEHPQGWPLDRFNGSGRYVHMSPANDWEVWQASRKAALEALDAERDGWMNLMAEARKVALEQAAKTCEDMHEEDRPSDYAYAIRSLADRSPT